MGDGRELLAMLVVPVPVPGMSTVTCSRPGTVMARAWVGCGA
jgi:hypothetical protein